MRARLSWLCCQWFLHGPRFACVASAWDSYPHELMCCADEQPPEGPIPEWGCWVEYGMAWCDGECIALSDNSCCGKRCVNDYGNPNRYIRCAPTHCLDPKRCPASCDYQTTVWCSVNGESCEIKEDVTEGNVACASTCIVATSDEGKRTLECSSDTSRGYTFGLDPGPDPDQWHREGYVCGFSVVEIPSSSRRPRHLVPH